MHKPRRSALKTWLTNVSIVASYTDMAGGSSISDSRAQYQSRKGYFATVVTAIVLSCLCGHGQAVCSPCPFQWWEYQQHCYQYFPWLLPYDQAEQYCRGQHARRYTGGLATVDSLHEMLFLMDFLEQVTNQSLDTNISNHLWLSKADKSYGK